MTGTYDVPYYILGGFSITASALSFMSIPIINRRKRQLLTAKSEDSEKVTDPLSVQKRTRKHTVNSIGSGITSTWSLAL